MHESLSAPVPGAIFANLESIKMDDLPQIRTIRNGKPFKHTFSKKEYASRLAKLRAHMSEAGLDAVLLTSYHNINYYSDWIYCYFGRNAGLVVTQDNATTISPNIDYGQAGRRTACGDNITYTDWHRDNFFVAVKKLIKDDSRVGIEYDHISFENLRKLQGALPASSLLDVGKATMRLRMIKSDEEIKHITESARIADVGGAACVEAIGVGVPEYEVALHTTQAMVREIAKTFPDGELMDTWTWFQSGGVNSDGAHNPVTTRKIERGDILSLSAFPMPAGYYTALERTLFAEECSKASRKYWDINIEVFEAGKKMIKPGVKCADIANALNDIYRHHGVLQHRTFGYGHSFGVICHYYGREAGLELREDIDTVLQPNMVVSMEPQITIPDGEPGAGGYREHDILVVTKTGAENITKFPYGPEHNIIKH